MHTIGKLNVAAFKTYAKFCSGMNGLKVISIINFWTPQNPRGEFPDSHTKWLITFYSMLVHPIDIPTNGKLNDAAFQWYP